MFGFFPIKVVATLDRGVFGFLPTCASKNEIFVTPCDVTCRDFVIVATSDANLYGVFAGSFRITPSLRFMCLYHSFD